MIAGLFRKRHRLSNFWSRIAFVEFTPVKALRPGFGPPIVLTYGPPGYKNASSQSCSVVDFDAELPLDDGWPLLAYMLHDPLARFERSWSARVDFGGYPDALYASKLSKIYANSEVCTTP